MPRRFSNLLVIGVALLGVTLGLLACAPAALREQPVQGQPAQTRESTRSSPSSAPQQTIAPGAAAGPVEISDATGRIVKLETPPQRIAVAGRASFMVLHALFLFPEGRERLIALDKKVMTSLEFLDLVAPHTSEKATLGASPGVEQIVAAKPDLVLLKSPAMEDVAESLGDLGIAVAYLGLETPAQFEQDVAVLGLLLGNHARAEEIIAFYRSKEESVQKALAGISDEQKPRVLLCQYSTKGNEVAVSVPAEAWMQTIEVQMAGGLPAWLENAEPSNGWKVVNLEQIVQWNPEQIVVVAYGADPEEILATLRADATWSALNAVKQGDLHVFPADYFGWDMADPRWILGVEWLATQFHSDRLGGLNMTDEMYQFFGQLYGMDRSAVDAEIMPKVKLDVH